MSYTPGKVTAIDTSGDVDKLSNSVVDLTGFLENELAAISSALQDPLMANPEFVVPVKPRQGQIAYADGVHWNPGSGEGIYVFESDNAWHYLQVGVSASHGVKLVGNDIQLSLLNAVLQSDLTDPSTTTSTTGVMMGFGGVAKLTPVYSERIRFEIIGTLRNSVAGINSNVGLRFGTGTAPTNGMAVTGTALGKQVFVNPASAGGGAPFCIAGIATGLTPGTAYWFDANLVAGANTASITVCSCNAMEF